MCYRYDEEEGVTTRGERPATAISTQALPDGDLLAAAGEGEIKGEGWLQAGGVTPVSLRVSDARGALLIILIGCV
jgi:hypothetical protein